MTWEYNPAASYIIDYCALDQVLPPTTRFGNPSSSPPPYQYHSSMLLVWYVIPGKFAHDDDHISVMIIINRSTVD
eukprot:scaffold8405_cov169-Amphora_coffeaeformis.AAC.6